ncbi:hypothetical protein [Microbacterium hatanonis]|uniref:Capsular polysaccharide biosynthesis protein n=1 Tax=Microbacterium hatanonis TaxID=404366 RepID=A0A5C8HWD5_9MICO|nr:hypothetical protein [Microbacterium hatanonis]TXK10287.1 hypothetical protein FVP77_15695 [Microbacterium hatanonis]
MEQPRYVRRLLNQKILLIIGLVVAVAAGLLAGFTIKDGAIESRVERTYQASSTVLLTSAQPTYFQVEIPGSTQALPQPSASAAPDQQVVVTESTPIDLSGNAIILAYLASSDEVVDSVASEVGGLEDGEAITAVRRTTQPAGDEQFGGRLELPIIDIVGVSTSPARAELLAAEATSVFSDIVLREQTEWGVPEDVRLVLDEVNAPVAGEGEGSNPAIPIVVVAVGVLLLFIALALIIEAVRDRRRRAGDDADDTDDAYATAEPVADDDDDDAPIAGVRRSKRSSSRSVASDDTAPIRRRGRTGQTAEALSASSVENDDATADARR